MRFSHHIFSPKAFVVVSQRILVALQYTTKRPSALTADDVMKPAAKSAVEIEREIFIHFHRTLLINNTDEIIKNEHIVSENEKKFRELLHKFKKILNKKKKR